MTSETRPASSCHLIRSDRFEAVMNTRSSSSNQGSPAGLCGSFGPMRRFIDAVRFCCVGVAFGVGCAVAGERAAELNMVASSAVFVDVNESDARAALKMWSKTLAEERGIPVGNRPMSLGPNELDVLMQQDNPVAIIMTMRDYARLSRKYSFDPVYTIVCDGKARQQYRLVVRRDSGIRNLGDLKGKRLMVHESIHSLLAPIWLDVALNDAGLPRAARHVGQMKSDIRSARVVLPVYFKQADAALISRFVFETMVALNPQINEELIDIAESGELVPGIFALRSDYNPPFREKLIRGLESFHNSPLGAQLLSVFRGDRLVRVTAVEMESTINMIRRYEAIK